MLRRNSFKPVTKELTMLKEFQFREIVKPVLSALKSSGQFEHNLEDLEELLILVFAHESLGGTYIRQLGNGPARGFFQMEPATEKDCWDNWLKYKVKLTIVLHDMIAPGLDNLTYNIAYQIAMAAIRLTRTKDTLPKKSDVNGLAAHWKKHYNTSLGKGTTEEAIKNYKSYVENS